MQAATVNKSRGTPTHHPFSATSPLHVPSLSSVQALRPDSVILMGKNTMMKRSIRLYCEETGNDQWAPILDMLVGNVGLVFTKADLSQVRGAERWETVSLT